MPEELAFYVEQEISNSNSTNIWYAARNRSQIGKPWFNGDAMILEPETGTVVLVSWNY